MKKNSGISIITLVITIVVLIILAGTTIYYGVIKNINITGGALAQEEIQSVSEAVAQRADLHRLDNSRYNLIGEPLSNANPVIIDDVSYGDDWYLLKPAESIKLSLEEVKREYVINYKTGEIVSLTPITIDGKDYYSSADIQEITGGRDNIITEDMYDTNKGVNKPVLYKGMIPVKIVNNQWVVTSSSDSEWYDYSVQNRAWANVMMTDEITVEGYTNEQIREASLAELEGLTVTTSGSMFVWIPRFSSNAVGEVIFSEGCNDTTEPGYIVSNEFKYGNRDLPGKWYSKYDVEYGS